MTLLSGYKTFANNAVLPAEEINGYLMQGILVFNDASDRDTSLVGNLREGRYAYLKSDKTTYVYSGTLWQRVGKQDVDTTKNFQSFTGSGSITAPEWATKMYYCIVAGGRRGGDVSVGTNGGAGGAVLQGDTAVSPGVTVTVTVGASDADSSVAVSGGSTFTASGAGAAGGTSGNAGANGTTLSAPFAVGVVAGGGGGYQAVGNGGRGGSGGFGDGGSASHIDGAGQFSVGARAGGPNSGGGGGGGPFSAGGGPLGGSGLVLLYFS
jgi:hypothetical protein